MSGGCRAVLTHARVVVGCQLEAGVALAVVGAGRVDAAVMAVWGQRALIDVCGTKKTRVSSAGSTALPCCSSRPGKVH